MNPVEKIREQHKAAQLQSLAAKPHRKRIMHLDDIRSIGIIVHNLTDAEQITLAQFTHHMTTNRGSMVRKIEINGNTEEQLDKYGLPKVDCQLFTSYHYDLLINATPTNDIFGIYITLNASSNLRVAYYDTTQPIQDITLSSNDLIIRGQGPLNLSKYLTDLLNCLIQIRKTPSGHI